MTPHLSTSYSKSKTMKKTALLATTSFLAFLVFTSGTNNPTGKAGYSGSPGEGTCASCHSDFTLNSGPGSVQITTNIPSAGYAAGQSYTVNVIGTQSGKQLFGLAFEALNASNSNIGTLAAGTGTHTANAGNGRKNITHSSGGGATANAHTFTFTWTAPATGSGTANFYCALAACDGTGNEANDYVYSTSTSFDEATAPNGVVDATPQVALTVFPNPASEKLFARVYHLSNEKAEASLVANDGRVISNEVFSVSGFNEQTASFDVKGLPAGIYQVNIQQGGQRITKSVVLQ